MAVQCVPSSQVDDRELKSVIVWQLHTELYETCQGVMRD
jgi:hypothetical protein